MAQSQSRRERLMKLIGEENLPAKLPQPTQQSEEENEANEDDLAKDPLSNLQPAYDFVKEAEANEWWNFTAQTVPRPTNNSSQEAMSRSAAYMNDPSIEFDPRCGEPAPLGITFTPFQAIAKFPYKFVPKNLSQKLATAFFDANKIYNREWDIYYVWSDYYPTAKPVTFVPGHQLLALVDEINQAFPDANITITEELRKEGLIINFDDCTELRPRWLGHTTSRTQYTSWTENLTMPKQGTITSDRTLQAFKEKMDLATEISKNKSKAAKAKKQIENIAKRQNMAKSLLRTQRYLGLAPEESLLPDIASLSMSPIDCNTLSPHPFTSDVIFIAVDVEAYEHPPRYITEIGVATLDTRDLAGHAPGEAAKNWQQHIRGRHFRINEFKNLVNKTFIQGCPTKFEFGKSEFIPKNAIGSELAKCFKSPYSGKPSTVEEKRNVILVGHDIGQDISYLQQVGFNVLNSSNIVDKIDTAELHRVYKQDPNPRSLGNVLYEFDLMGWHLHNAGNDAVYTLWAMLAVCVRAALERGEVEEQKRRTEESLEKRTEAAIEQARERVREEFDGWKVEGDDGGVPVGVGGTDKSGGKGRGDGGVFRRSSDLESVH